MNKKTKKSFIELGIIIAIFGGLYITGLHTEVLGFLQRGILATGIMNPKIETDPEIVENKEYHRADFSMSLINSKGERLEMEDLKGKVIFLNIWATWCPPCVAEMPGINKLYKDVDKDKVAFILLSVDHNFQKAVDYNNQKGYDFDVYDNAGRMPDMYITQSIPTTYVINAIGDLVLTHIGMGDYDTQEFRQFLINQY